MNKTSRTSEKERTLTKSTKLLALECHNCGHTIDSKDININSSLAKCGNCNTVSRIKNDTFFERQYNYNPRQGRPEMIMPEGTDVLTLTSSLDIRVDWLQSHPKNSLGFLTFFTVLWNGILAAIGTGMIASGALSSLAFLSVHALVGIGLFYYLASVYLNYTDIIITSDSIQISQRPIKNPFRAAETFNTRNIKQIYVNKYVKSTSNGVPNYAYSLHAKMTDKTSPVTILKGMNRETQLYLEQELERYLNIQDADVAGSITE